MTAECPCCGQRIKAGLDIDQLKFLKFGHVETTFLRILTVDYPHFTSKSAVIERIYGHGGPLNSSEVISTTKKRLSQKLEPFGWKVQSNNRGRAGAFYALRKI